MNHFIQPDSIISNPSDPQSWNRYSYVQNDPIRYSDPTGHRICDDIDGYGNCAGKGTKSYWDIPGVITIEKDPPSNDVWEDFLHY
ncbi:MAG TPA: hypothetical protein DCX53_07285 [Anaerolineae bacterium]|nr:hypothetical protein [Anaerolineae bacterium]